MRTLCLFLLSLLLLTALPGLAAPTTEVIPLTHASASDVERFFLPSHVRQQTPGPVRILDDLEVFPGLIDPVTGAWFLPGMEKPAGQAAEGGQLKGTETPRGLLPRGITALAVDPRKNTLTVSGEEDDVQRVKQIIRLLDIPLRRIRLSIQILEFDPEVFQAAPLKGGVELDTNGIPARVAILEEQEADALGQKAKRVLVKSELVTANNRPVRVFWPQGDAVREGYGEVIPRVNGDGTITLFVPQAIAKVEDGKTTWRKLHAVRRIASGQTVAVGPIVPGIALLVQPLLLPEQDVPKPNN